MVNTITFGGVNSSTYDIYVSGEGVWSAPKRDTEAINIPGRNGAFIQDKGKFENITVTYPAFIVKDNNTNFKTKIDGFRNAMASQVGYQRLVDTFHPDEYRMAAFINGLEVEPILYNDHAATFDLVFECMPQRFLTSGETKTTLTSPATVTNPTLFASKPMFELTGYGGLDINTTHIELINQHIGEIVVASQFDEIFIGTTKTFAIDDTYANVGDPIRFESGGLVFAAGIGQGNGISVSNASLSVTGTGTNASGFYKISPYYLMAITLNLDSDNALRFTYGTSKTVSAVANIGLTVAGLGPVTGTITITIAYDGSDTFTYTRAVSFSNSNIYVFNPKLTFGEILLDSSTSVLGNPVYLDLDIGEAYKIEYGSVVSVNSAVNMPSKLPVLVPGNNTITFDNTFTKVDLIPRWWQI